MKSYCKLNNDHLTSVTFIYAKLKKQSIEKYNYDLIVKIVPLLLTEYLVNPDGGGPPNTVPVFALKVPPWHGQVIANDVVGL